MPKLIYAINSRNKSFNLLKQVYKDFGVVFHPNSTVVSVENFIKEKANGKALPKLQAKYDKAIVREKDLLEKLKKIRNNKKSLAWKIHQTKYHPAMV